MRITRSLALLPFKIQFLLYYATHPLFLKHPTIATQKFFLQWMTYTASRIRQLRPRPWMMLRTWWLFARLQQVCHILQFFLSVSVSLSLSSLFNLKLSKLDDRLSALDNNTVYYHEHNYDNAESSGFGCLLCTSTTSIATATATTVTTATVASTVVIIITFIILHPSIDDLWHRLSFEQHCSSGSSSSSAASACNPLHFLYRSHSSSMHRQLILSTRILAYS